MSTVTVCSDKFVTPENPSGRMEIDQDNPNPDILATLGWTRLYFEQTYNNERNWSNFRHDLKESDIFQLVATSANIPAVMGAYLMDSLRQIDYEDLVQACTMVDGIMHFTPEQKTEVNDMAAANYLPGPLF